MTRRLAIANTDIGRAPPHRLSEQLEEMANASLKEAGLVLDGVNLIRNDARRFPWQLR
jgi:hypothetical protein